jgi:hypothetical protein
VIVIAYLTSKSSVANVPDNTFSGDYARRTALTVAANLFTNLCHVTLASSVTGFAHVPFGHSSSQAVEPVIVSIYLIH